LRLAGWPITDFTDRQSRKAQPSVDFALALTPARQKTSKNGAGFASLEKCLGDFDLLALRRNNADPIVVLPWRVWAALLAKVRRAQ
jgi:hypothetical protein